MVAIGRHMRLLVQLAATLVILAFVPGNVVKAILFLVVWGVGFGRVTCAEVVLFVAACGFFTIMNALSLQQGIFAFSRPDFLGMPAYEIFMWGFYLLHTRRMVGGAAPQGREAVAWVLAILYAVAFGTIADQGVLLVVTAVLLIVALGFFHERLDFAYMGYMIFLGAAIEYTGVLSGEWYYPGDPVGGVPPWFITLWGGVGLFLRRLVLPIVMRFEARHDAARARV